MVSKENFYFTILELLKEGKNPTLISKQLNISKQKISYYIHKFKERGYIEKKGYGTWEVKKHTLSQLDFKPKKSIRGHAFVWTIKLHKEYDWIKQLGTTKYNLIRGIIPRIFINNRKIWLGKKNIVIYENKSFYANNSINSRKYAVLSLLTILDTLEHKLKVNLKPYTFKTSREHYGMIKNDLAIQCNKNNEKILIHDDLEGDWLWIDDSESLGELETGGKKAVVRSKQVQDWYNDHKKHDFKVTPTFLIESIHGLTTSQQGMINTMSEYAKHIKAHTRSIVALSKAIPQLTKLLKDTKEENSKLKQRKLSEF